MKRAKLIIISGTPGVGKSTLAVKLAKKLGFGRLDLHKHYKEIAEYYDRSKQSYVIDIKKLERLVKERLKEADKNGEKGIVFDSHIAHLLPNKLVDAGIVLICSNLKKLKGRLEKRKYTQKKVVENMEAEMLQLCLGEAKDKKHKIVVFDASKRVKITEAIQKIRKYL